MMSNYETGFITWVSVCYCTLSFPKKKVLTLTSSDTTLIFEKFSTGNGALALAGWLFLILMLEYIFYSSRGFEDSLSVLSLSVLSLIVLNLCLMLSL